MFDQLSARGFDDALSSDEAQLYGPPWATVLAPLRAALRHRSEAILDELFELLGELPGLKPLVAALSEVDLRHLRQRLSEHLQTLAAPTLTPARHHKMATQLGQLQAMIGMAKKDLAEGHDALLVIMHRQLDAKRYGEALSVLARRLLRDLAWQIEAAQRLQAMRHEVQLQATRIAWSAHSYTDLIRHITALLTRHPEIAACCFSRPDPHGKLRHEAAAGPGMKAYLARLEEDHTPPTIVGESDHAQGPIGRSWRSGAIEHCVNFATDARMTPWREAAQRHGFRSSVALPMSQPGGRPTAILSLYSACPGGFTSADQRAFIEQLQTILVFAISRIESQRGPAQLVPLTVRQRWGELLRSEALEMHYQPMLSLRDWKVRKVEALARLRDGDRLLSPAEFLPAFSSDDLLELYTRGLSQALSQRTQWLRQGIDVSLSINLPPDALGDSRYFEVTRQALIEHACPAHELTLEILESREVPHGVDVAAELATLKALGVSLSEDDLGAGHSSLSRLRELPFDCIKIDRSLVSGADREASDVLRFIYQLTRLGHSLGKSVIVEGVEDRNLLEAVKILGADAIQGYALARPLSAAQMTEWLRLQPLPEALDPQCPRGTLAKLARLLIWEEGMHLRSLEHATGGAGHLPDAATLALRCVDTALLEALLAAARVHGLASSAYGLARSRLIGALISADAALH